VNAYSIKDLEKLSGIKAHTIRVWEQRYGIISPRRTPTNIRYYLDKDLIKLLDVVFLYQNGYKISKIALLNDSDIETLKSEISHQKFSKIGSLDALTIATTDLDEHKFNKVVADFIAEKGFYKTMMELIYPFLDKLAVLWLTGSITPARELFVANLIRQKVISAIDRETSNPDRLNKKFLLFLPEGEIQELGLLFLHFILKSKGFPVLYLGKGIGLEELKDAHSAFNPDYMFTILSESFISEPVQSLIDRLSNEFSNTSIIFSGFPLVSQKPSSHANTLILKDLKDTENYLEQLIIHSTSFQLN
jgi:MerR family transcriptional regulator, light-induced transcriptional regulator